MEDTLVTVAIHTYEKAQVLRSLLEAHDIEVYMQDVNPLIPAMSLGIRVKIRQSDLNRALPLIENMKNTETMQGMIKEKASLLLPVDFSDYSIKLCKFGFKMANALNLNAILFHTYTVNKTMIGTLGEVYTNKKDGESKRVVEQNAHNNLKLLSETLETIMEENKIPRIQYRCVLREGIPEEQIIEYSQIVKPYAIIMGTRGCSQNDLNMIGSVTAEVMERSNYPVFTVPECSPVSLENVRNIACSTNFEDGDLAIYNKMFEVLNSQKENRDLTLHFIHYDSEDDNWAEIKLLGLKDYFKEKFPLLKFDSHILTGNDLLSAYDKFIRENNIDVVSLTTHKRNLLKRLFNPSVARKIVFHTNTPMMVFHIR